MEYNFIEMMSQEELRAQHETVNTIAVQIKSIVKWWPTVLVLFGVISATVTITVSAVSYNANVVKRPEFDSFVNKSNNRYVVDSIKTVRFRERSEDHWMRIEQKLKISPALSGVITMIK